MNEEYNDTLDLSEEQSEQLVVNEEEEQSPKGSKEEVNPETLNGDMESALPFKKIKLHSTKPSDDMILCSTFHHVFLYDARLNCLSSLYNVIPRAIVPVPAFMRHMVGA